MTATENALNARALGRKPTDDSHEDVRERSGADSGAGMATTLTLMLFVWPRAYLLQVGDSRYYILRDGTLTQLSRDQTLAQVLVDDDVFSRTEASKSPLSHVLSSAIGGSATTPVVTGIDQNWNYVHLLHRGAGGAKRRVKMGSRLHTWKPAGRRPLFSQVQGGRAQSSLACD